MNKTFFIFFLFLLISCTEKDPCGNDLDISGVYENKFEKGVTNYLIIKNDGTFEQRYRKQGTIKKNKGKWRYRFDGKNYCSIKFDTLKVLHYVPYRDEESEAIERMSAIFRRNKIMFYEDFPFEYDFVKTNKKIEKI